LRFQGFGGCFQCGEFAFAVIGVVIGWFCSGDVGGFGEVEVAVGDAVFAGVVIFFDPVAADGAVQVAVRVVGVFDGDVVAAGDRDKARRVRVGRE
jgi:hypothetical protein